MKEVYFVIEASQEVVWQQVKYFNNWKNWSPWYAKDSTMTWSFEGTDGELESAYAWLSEQSGSGKMTNTGVTEGEELLYHTHFLEPFESESNGYIQLVSTENGTKVKWGFTGVNKGIASLFLNMDKMVGPDFEGGLLLLKAQGEKVAAGSKSGAGVVLSGLSSVICPNSALILLTQFIPQVNSTAKCACTSRRDFPAYASKPRYPTLPGRHRVTCISA